MRDDFALHWPQCESWRGKHNANVEPSTAQQRDQKKNVFHHRDMRGGVGERSRRQRPSSLKNEGTRATLRQDMA